MHSDLYDITIIGGGPVGLFGAFYAGLRGMRVKIIDSLPELGGQLTALYPEKYVYDMPGFPEVLAKDLAREMIRQAMRFKPTVCLEERAETLTRTDDSWAITTHTGQVHYTRTIVICAGAGAFAPRKLNAEGVAAFEGNGVYYGVREKSLFAGKRLLIVGGGRFGGGLGAEPVSDSAGSHPSFTAATSFRAHEQSVQELRRSPVKILTPYETAPRVRRWNRRARRRLPQQDPRRDRTAHRRRDSQSRLRATLGPIKSWGTGAAGQPNRGRRVYAHESARGVRRRRCVYASREAQADCDRRRRGFVPLSTTPRASSTPPPRCSQDTAATWSCLPCEKRRL
jgi:cation diffusion facilitator CzcD-associated flavoprotein CzcO